MVASILNGGPPDRSGVDGAVRRRRADDGGRKKTPGLRPAAESDGGNSQKSYETENLKYRGERVSWTLPKSGFGLDVVPKKSL